jgi:hypothetical protein
MRTAAIAVAAVLLIAAAAYTADAVKCGSLGDMPLSGCLICEPATVNLTGKDGWHGFKGRGLHQAAASARSGGGRDDEKPPGREDGKPPGRDGNRSPEKEDEKEHGKEDEKETSVSLPNCTSCDTTNNFTAMAPISSSKWAHPNLGRCGEWACCGVYQQHSSTLPLCRAANKADTRS